MNEAQAGVLNLIISASPYLGISVSVSTSKLNVCKLNGLLAAKFNYVVTSNFKIP